MRDLEALLPLIMEAVDRRVLEDYLAFGEAPKNLTSTIFYFCSKDP